MKEEENKLEKPLSLASMSTLNTGGAWTNRREMWILEEKRLLFSTKEGKDREEWMEVLD